MEFDKKKLEKWILEIPECGDFLNNFFSSCKEDTASALVNYKEDIRLYGFNLKILMVAFEDISRMRVYYG